ncbi:MAG: transcriptional repressor [Holophagales bacterium]|jgi:Fur family ferric uptake transcriptional regulator|nr:transcriptional repressor [Holophagales bacterium]
MKRPRPERGKTRRARWTGPRDEVFNVLERTEEHLSAKDIFVAIRPSNPNIGLTTVYRTLELLARANLVRRVCTHSGELRFEYRRGDQSDHHHHIICTACGKSVNYRDFETEELDLVRRTEERLASKRRFLNRDHSIEFLGLCEGCRPGGARSLLNSPNPEAPPPKARSRPGSGPPAEGEEMRIAIATHQDYVASGFGCSPFHTTVEGEDGRIRESFVIPNVGVRHSDLAELFVRNSVKFVFAGSMGPTARSVMPDDVVRRFAAGELLPGPVASAEGVEALCCREVAS